MEFSESYKNGILNPIYKFGGKHASGISGIEGNEYKFIPKNIVIVGNGAVRGADEIIENALSDFYSKESSQDIYMLKSSGLSLDLKLALEAFSGRVNWTLLEREILGDVDPILAVVQEGIDGPLSGIDRDARLRNYIGNVISSSDISLRKIPSSIQDILGPETAFITTNWDNALWNSDHFENGMYLHGRCSFGPSLVFPTELVMEDKIHTNTLDTIVKNAESDLRYRDIRTRIGESLDFWKWASTKNSGMLPNWISEAENIFVWGYAFNTYDAEVHSLLRMAVAERMISGRKFKKLVVINKNGDHAQLAARIFSADMYVGELPL